MAGYDSHGIGHLQDVRVPGPDGAALFPSGPATSNTGTTWRGQVDVINRLLHGFDVEAFEAGKVEVSGDVASALQGLAYKLIPPLAVQDAIDCAAFLIRTTIDMQRFSDGIRTEPDGTGIPGCGGPIRILHVGRNDVKWVSRPLLTDGTPPGSAEGALC